MLPPFPPSPPPTGRRPRISIVVTNYNYEEFVADAIRSALTQRDADVEVIVVDDGSTDSSREIVATFADRVRPIFQANKGQKGAFNTGYAAATGDVIVFLDADDELAPGVASTLADMFVAHPEVGRVVFRLAVVDREGRPTGALIPPADVPLPAGDVRVAALSHPDDIAWPPTSGNAFASWLLERILPLPLNSDPLGGDLLLHAITPLIAPVMALDRAGGQYRVHGRNEQRRRNLDIANSRRLLARSGDSHAAIRRMARELGYDAGPLRSVTLSGHRLISLRAEGSHPLTGDSRRRALGDGVRAALARGDVALSRRAVYLAWLVAIAYAPRPMARALARAALQQVRGWRPRFGWR